MIDLRSIDLLIEESESRIDNPLARVSKEMLLQLSR